MLHHTNEIFSLANTNTSVALFKQLHKAQSLCHQCLIQVLHSYWNISTIIAPLSITDYESIHPPKPYPHITRSITDVGLLMHLLNDCILSSSP